MALDPTDPLTALLMGNDPAGDQRRMAERLRGQDAMKAMMTGANKDAQGLDILNFVAQNSNNKDLANSVGMLTRTRQALRECIRLRFEGAAP